MIELSPLYCSKRLWLIPNLQVVKYIFYMGYVQCTFLHGGPVHIPDRYFVLIQPSPLYYSSQIIQQIPKIQVVVNYIFQIVFLRYLGENLHIIRLHAKCKL